MSTKKWNRKPDASLVYSSPGPKRYAFAGQYTDLGFCSSMYRLLVSAFEIDYDGSDALPNSTRERLLVVTVGYLVKWQ